MRHAPLATAVITACITSPVFAAENIETRAEERSEERAQQRSAQRLSPVVITAPQTASVLTVSTDPKAPRQPVPAHDGADLLKNIPGFSVIRKGGTDGDPVFRGMAASRLGILLDGETIMGGCGMRMDPPTAYVYPEAYDEVVMLKGPQTVKYGPGNSAGVVMFERAEPDFSSTPVQADASLLFGSAERNDQMAQVLAGGKTGYVSVNGTRADANDYEDGDGNKVHSAYTRWSSNAAIGWTPSADTRIELSGAVSDGEARYGDRAMDGVAFERSNIGLSAEQNNVSPLISKIEGRIYRNYVDHVMDNFSLRSVNGMKMVSNPDRDTKGAALSMDLTPADSTQVAVGVDTQRNEHSLRAASAMAMGGMEPADPDYEDVARESDMRFETWGIWTELDQQLTDHSSLHAGLRLNRDYAKDLRESRDSYGETSDDTLKNAFIRYEQQLSQANTVYAGVGHSERGADYWERTKSPAATGMGSMNSGSASSFDLNPEKTTQLDLGILHHNGDVSASLSAFYAKHKDYILIESLSMFASDARNIDATTYGAEADASWDISSHWNTTSTLAWVHGDNNDDHSALGQIPPLELRFGVNYQLNNWSAGALWRVVAEQNRVAIGTGNVVGQDISKSAGFNVFSLNTGYRAGDHLTVTAGIDNLFDVTYAEHISRSGANITGYEQTERINEPGRTYWLKLQWALH
ncbi:MAG: TonB-dependent copper receptor [Oceanospirillaceae bacterium]|uniref:TonB-dependent copper receptor n=1 Tax=unclassified Thalassolituus TaxID=2624967 RepID=UPI000C0B4651|nr:MULTISPECIES: TonB-dependent copper receptor [unclassified Thalassolituus]MAK92610.1 TonB-dependent copper receptor [Thalassolituus sp.]MAS26300.1 TonB-dependent copper receptor [Oceanospirillaceae bacterium]MAY01000.1 TonB-dependent copper receptor [Oceanospirillaceae bacterium]MBL34641.1 TonB-dependent copper receptor [Oceanospirillaceae bacterium]MBS52489.1 TonB-dependent copper receptor [Oceanospirillaceae bacterium]